MRLRHEDRVTFLALASGLPALLTAVALVWSAPHGAALRWGLPLALLVAWIALLRATRRTVVKPLQTLSNLLAALRSGDYSFRGRSDAGRGALTEVHREANTLADTLQSERWSASEATALLRKVMDAIDVAVLAFDAEGRLRLLNRAAQTILGEPNERVMGRTAQELRVAALLEGETPRIAGLDLPGAGGRWELRRAEARRGGLPLTLLVLSNLTVTLRLEERLAWQRLIRVLGHEINNSLAPIQSIAESLKALIGKTLPPDDWKDDAHGGLNVIAARARSLGSFLGRAATLARVPAPRMEAVSLRALVERVCPIETRAHVVVEPGVDVTLLADPDQIEQVLINLLRNAAEAAPGSVVEVGWDISRGATPVVGVWVDDRGPGIANPENLFVPLFTTKPGGSGIGLALSRQIAEAHGGSLTLSNRHASPGARALLRLPVEACDTGRAEGAPAADQ